MPGTKSPLFPQNANTQDIIPTKRKHSKQNFFGGVFGGRVGGGGGVMRGQKGENSDRAIAAMTTISTTTAAHGNRLSGDKLLNSPNDHYFIKFPRKGYAMMGTEETQVRHSSVFRVKCGCKRSVSTGAEGEAGGGAVPISS